MIMMIAQPLQISYLKKDVSLERKDPTAEKHYLEAVWKEL